MIRGLVSAGPTLSFLGLVDTQSAAVEFIPVEGLLRSLCALGRFEFDEAESAGPSRLSIGDHVDRHDLSVRSKQGLKLLFRGGEGKVPYVQFAIQLIFSLGVPFGTLIGSRRSRAFCLEVSMESPQQKFPFSVCQ